MARRQLIGPRRGPTRPEQSSSIFSDACRKLRIRDVIPEPTIPAKQKAGAGLGELWTAHLPHRRQHARLAPAEQPVQRRKMAWLVRARKWLDEDPDHSTTAQADSQIDDVLVGRVVGHQARFTTLDGPLRSKDHEIGRADV